MENQPFVERATAVFAKSNNILHAGSFAWLENRFKLWNPTKLSDLVADFVKFLRTLEARKQGTVSKTRRTLEEREF
jgi:hypothetical protein